MVPTLGCFCRYYRLNRPHLPRYQRSMLYEANEQSMINNQPIPPENTASIHIAEKIGMHYKRDVDQWGQHFRLYAVKQP